MKGVLLAGGHGTRLAPMTGVVNKHLLDVFDEPMVFYPLRSLADAGITDIVLVTGREVEQFQQLLGTGEAFGVNLSYAVQEGEGGAVEPDSDWWQKPGGVSPRCRSGAGRACIDLLVRV